MPGYSGWQSPPGSKQGNRKPLVTTASVIAAVLIVVTSLVSCGDSEGSGTAGDAVKKYLDALARGDAAAALRYSTDKPGSKDFLSDEILKKQVAEWPISGVEILDDNSDHSSGVARVHVVARFGGNTSEVTLPLKKHGKYWKLEHAAIKVEPVGVIDNGALKTLRFFGSSVGTAPVYVFPGWLESTSSNPNVAVKQKKPFLLEALSSSGGYFDDFEYRLSDAGQQATMSALSAALAECTASASVMPPGCPQRVRDPDIVDGTVSWGTADTSGLRLSIFDPHHLEVRFTGDAQFPLTAKTKTGDTKSSVVKVYMSAKADVSRSPPDVSIR